MNKPLVSVIMTAYNGQRFIAESIESILQQTYANWELIIVNDGSVDRTEEVAKGFLGDKRIKYHQHERNLGLAPTHNTAFSLASGKYLAIQDCDDISLPHRLEREVEILAKYPQCGLVFAKAYFMDIYGEIFTMWGGDEIDPGLLSKEKAFQTLYFVNNFVPNPSVMMRRWKDNNPWYNPAFKDCCCNDFEYYLRAARNHHFYYIPEPLVKMRRDKRHHSMTTKKENNFREKKKIIRHIYQLYCNAWPTPITLANYFRAISYQLIKESSYYLNNSSKLKGKLIALQAMFYNPIDKRVLLFVIEHIFSKKILKLLAKIKHLLL